MNETNEGFTVTLRVKDADGMEVDWSFDTWGGPEATAGEAIDTALQYCDHEVVGFVGVEVNAERNDCDECGTGGGGLCPECKADAETH